MKRTLTGQVRDTIVGIDHENACYVVRVENCPTHLNEAHLMVGTSTIPKCWKSHKPWPLANSRPIAIPKGNTLYYYARHTIPAQNNLATRDYYIPVGAKHYDASVFTGDKYGPVHK